MTLSKHLSPLLMTFALVILPMVGCTSTPTQEGTGEYMSDSFITSKVKAALVADTLVRATEVNVETFRGVVQLSGFVSSSAAMEQAVKLTRDIKGVSSVKNDMRVK